MAHRGSGVARGKVFIATVSERDGRNLSEWLTRAGLRTIQQNSLRDVQRGVQEARPDLVVFDVGVEDLRGASAIEDLKSTPLTRSIPVIVLTRRGEASVDAVQTAWPEVDCLPRPFSAREFVARAKALMRVAREGEPDSAPGSRDSLTSLYNRRYLDERLQKEVERARRYARSLSCILIDIDGLKQINAAHGHAAGDSLLRTLADALLAGTRQSDVVGRFGGEEFLVILPETSTSDAGVLSERLRASFVGRAADNVDIAATISCGVASYPEDASDVSTLIRMADSGVYRAKAEGGNRTGVAVCRSTRADAPLERAPRILLVEGNEYARSVTSIVLRTNGYEVIEAEDDTSAVSLVREERPDLVLIDVNLHRTGTLEATSQFAHMEELREVPVLAMTSSDIPDDLLRLSEAGCCGYIMKPIDTNNLASKIELFLRS